MPNTVKIVERKKLPSVDPKRLGKYDLIFVVELAPGDMIFVRVPDEEFTEEKLQDAIREQIKERGEWAGKELQV